MAVTEKKYNITQQVTLIALYLSTRKLPVHVIFQTDNLFNLPQINNFV